MNIHNLFSIDFSSLNVSFEDSDIDLSDVESRATASPAAAALQGYSITDGTGEKAFYDAKIKTAQFYFAKLLPRTTTHVQRISTGVEPYMTMDVDQFAF